jgi:chromatin segregation and condensation protein Rec8/ScpA/Scc1 (kleisin family)
MGFLWENISARGSGTLTDILPPVTSRRALITAFLALLELTRLCAVYLVQEKAFGEITARANPNYELSRSFTPA